MNKHPSRSKRWHCLSSSIVYKSPHVQVYSDDVQLPDGAVIQYTRFDDCPFAIVVPRIDDKLVMIYNYRYPLNEWCLEFPSGHIKPEEKPQEAACRELEEETGYSAKKLQLVGEFCPSVRSSQKAYAFAAEVFWKGTLNRDRSELQRVVVLPIEKVDEIFANGEISHAASIIALFMSRHRLNSRNR